MPSAINVGDTVRLKSGGPLMTVLKEDSQGRYVCQWFVGGEKLEQGIFAAESLQPDSPSAGFA